MFLRYDLTFQGQQNGPAKKQKPITQFFKKGNDAPTENNVTSKVQNIQSKCSTTLTNKRKASSPVQDIIDNNEGSSIHRSSNKSTQLINKSSSLKKVKIEKDDALKLISKNESITQVAKTPEKENDFDIHNHPTVVGRSPEIIDDNIRRSPLCSVTLDNNTVLPAKLKFDVITKNNACDKEITNNLILENVEISPNSPRSKTPKKSPITGKSRPKI